MNGHVMIQIERLEIPEILLVKPDRFQDERGLFSETWRLDVLQKFGVANQFVQDNHAFTVEKYTLRGLHYQRGTSAQAKLIRVCNGAIFDVAVDLRSGSNTYGRWAGAELSRENGLQLYVPEGFAHGYVTLTPDTDVLYKASSYYHPEAETGLLWNDPTVGIAWPFPVEQAILNTRDLRWATLGGQSE